MNHFGRYLEDAWLGSTGNCCCALDPQPPARIEKPMRIEHHQPRLIPPPIPEPQERPSTRGGEWVAQSKSFASRASSRGSFSVRRKLNAYNGFHGRAGGMKISGPTDFQHVSASLPGLPRRTEYFRPLELSIYAPENQLSPILPHFGENGLPFPPEDMDVTYPPVAMTHSRSESALSFRIPRKPIRSSSATSSEWTAHFRPRPESLSTQELLAALEKELPKAPRPVRLRSLTEPPAYERVKSALHEKFELEQQLRDIEEVIEERRSIYMNSRPVSRATDTRPTSIYSESQEPMPVFPMPPPSFAARVALPLADQRPKTAPGKTVHIPTRHKSFTEASAAFTTPPQSSYSPVNDFPPPPPLPLVLQFHPPLRKKKSFSRVSNWLFPADHTRTTSLESVTNNPKPVTSREGFYQCINFQAYQGGNGNGNAKDRESVSTVSTMESELDAPTLPTTWSPHSSPGRFRDEKRGPAMRTFSMDSMDERSEYQEDGKKSEELSRIRTFGEKDESWRVERLPSRTSVGVAF